MYENLKKSCKIIKNVEIIKKVAGGFAAGSREGRGRVAGAGVAAAQGRGRVAGGSRDPGSRESETLIFSKKYKKVNKNNKIQ